MKTASDEGTEGQCYRFHVQRSWQLTIYLLLEVRPLFSPATTDISSCRFSLRPGSWQINCNKTLLPCVRLCPTPGRDDVAEPLQVGGNKKSPNNFAIPVITLEGFCCSLQAQNPGNILLEELNAILDLVIQELYHPSGPIFSLEISMFADPQKSTKCLFVLLHFSRILIFLFCTALITRLLKHRNSTRLFLTHVDFDFYTSRRCCM